MSDLIESAWRHYIDGNASITQEEAAAVWQAMRDLGDSDDRIYKVLQVGRWIDAEATVGRRCAVCAGIDGNHDDC